MNPIKRVWVFLTGGDKARTWDNSALWQKLLLAPLVMVYIIFAALAPIIAIVAATLWIMSKLR